MPPPTKKKENTPDPAFDRQREHKRIRIDTSFTEADLYEQYISSDRLQDEEAGTDEAIAYWISRYDSQRDLARFALDYSQFHQCQMNASDCSAAQSS
jgi:hypothetical protein